MRVFYTTMDLGDGSYSTVFCNSAECVKYLQDAYPETYPSGGEGCFNGSSIAGVHIYSLEEVSIDRRKLMAAREATARSWEKTYLGIERANVVAKIRSGEDPSAMGDVALCLEAIELFLANE